MNKQEALKEIERLKEFVSSYKEQELLVPECIQWEDKRLVFNDGKQVLGYCYYHEGVYNVHPAGFGPDMTALLNGTQPKLVPIKREDIKKGMWVFVSHDKTPNFSDKDDYFLVLEDKARKYCSLSGDEDVLVGTDIVWSYYWQVVFE